MSNDDLQRYFAENTRRAREGAREMAELGAGPKPFPVRPRVSVGPTDARTAQRIDAERTKRNMPPDRGLMHEAWDFGKGVGEQTINVALAPRRGDSVREVEKRLSPAKSKSEEAGRTTAQVTGFKVRDPVNMNTWDAIEMYPGGGIVSGVGQGGKAVAKGALGKLQGATNPTVQMLSRRISALLDTKIEGKTATDRLIIELGKYMVDPYVLHELEQRFSQKPN